MNVYPMFTVRGCVRPRMFQKVVTKAEIARRDRKNVEVDRKYVQFLYWSPKNDEIMPWRVFLKDVKEMYLVVTDDLERTLKTPARTWI